MKRVFFISPRRNFVIVTSVWTLPFLHCHDEKVLIKLWLPRGQTIVGSIKDRSQQLNHSHEEIFCFFISATVCVLHGLGLERYLYLNRCFPFLLFGFASASDMMWYMKALITNASAHVHLSSLSLLFAYLRLFTIPIKLFYCSLSSFFRSFLFTFLTSLGQHVFTGSSYSEAARVFSNEAVWELKLKTFSTKASENKDCLPFPSASTLQNSDCNN